MVYINFLLVTVVASMVIVGAAAYAASTASTARGKSGGGGGGGGTEALNDFVYDARNDIEYHPSADVVLANEHATGNGIWALNPKTGNVDYLKWADVTHNTLYYTPGTYPYGAATYVPTYEDSVYLSIMGRGLP